MNSPSLQPVLVSLPPAARPPLYRFEAQVDVVAVGIVPEGLRLVVKFDGRITEGIMQDARVWGVDHLLVRRDGVGVIDAPKTISSGDTHVYEHVRGYCLPPAGMTLPPLEAILEPGFTWPDAAFRVLGFSTFRAGAPELAALNETIASIEGHANFATGRLTIEARRAGVEASR